MTRLAMTLTLLCNARSFLSYTSNTVTKPPNTNEAVRTRAFALSPPRFTPFLSPTIVPSLSPPPSFFVAPLFSGHLAEERTRFPSFDRPYTSLAIGDAVRGFLSPTDSSYKSANLLGWRKISYREWHAASFHSFFQDGIVLDHEDLFQLPLLGSRYLMPHRGHSAHLVFQHNKQRAVAAKAMAPPPMMPKVPPPQSSSNGDKKP